VGLDGESSVGHSFDDGYVPKIIVSYSLFQN
jgi:hypothetical protein